MKILDQDQIQQKIKRLSFEIFENNFNEKDIYIAGINSNGLGFAKMLLKELKKRTKTKFHLIKISINPASPHNHPVEIDIESESLEGKSIIIVDDVANTGRTLFYAMKPFMDTLVKKIEFAVLVDRKHKSFPVKVDYVGLSLATTLQENIEVKIKDVKKQSVHLN